MKYLLILLVVIVGLISCADNTTYDLMITNAMIYDGSGKLPFQGSILINADTIVKVGSDLKNKAIKVLDAQGMAVSPGFINMLSWATESLIEDGRAMSDIKQGVTLEVMGEGVSMGPFNETMKRDIAADQDDIQYEVTWTTLGEYLDYLERKGVSTNVASFVGATTVRIHELGYENRAPTKAELDNMRSLVRQAMEEGAMGVGSSLIYAPAFYARTDELIALCEEAAKYDGMYITHMRSEGNQLLEAVDEVIDISRQAGIDAEIYHLKAAGRNNWHKIGQLITKLENARNSGITIAANMYNYEAGATGLDAAMPPWVQEGGHNAWAARLKDPKIRKQVISEMKTDATDWENLYFSAGDPDRVLFVDFRNDSLKKYTGKTLAQVSAELKTSPEETMIDLVIKDGSRVGTVYFLMSESNIKKQLTLPYMTFGSDAAALATEGVFLRKSTHPRAYGNVARLLGKYVREEKVIPLEEAIMKLSSLAAQKLKIKDRGLLAPGYFADVVIFNPEQIIDHATFENPHQYATGVIHVFVNGVQVLENGEHTGATPGRFIKGPGYLMK